MNELCSRREQLPRVHARSTTGGAAAVGAREKSYSSTDTNDSVMMLNVLSAVERDSHLTQRRLSRELGIALGLANAYLRRCINKGLIKVGQVPLNRYAYYLTPQGFAEKSRLTVEYLAWSFEFFRRARKQCSELLELAGSLGANRIVLFGTGELAEIALLSAGEKDMEVVCVVDANAQEKRCGGRPVVADMAAALALCDGHGFDVLMVTDLRDPHGTFEETLAIAKAYSLPPERILVPDLLQVVDRRNARTAAEGSEAVAS
jgi:hypothetical protein